MADLSAITVACQLGMCDRCGYDPDCECACHLTPRPVRDWERCDTGCGHMGGDCDCSCCFPDVDDDHQETITNV